MSTLKRSPLAPASFPDIPPLAGVRLGTAGTGVHYQGRDDLMLAEFNPAATVAGVLTRSLTASAPVLWCRDRLAGRSARALIVNAGNANAFTGEIGTRDVRRIGESVAERLDCPVDSVFIASTGVIGEYLPMERLLGGLPDAVANLDNGGWRRAARAIMTTDTFAKAATREVQIRDANVRINGFAKGSGMIEPDMATMLAFVFTDAAISAEVLQALLEEANALSFNAITVDSDTSTSDTCLLFATGGAGNTPPEGPLDVSLDAFRGALAELMQDLAVQVVRDGEGAEKLIEVRVEGAAHDADARLVAKSIANSPLVKTAIAGEDANWGRVVMAAGKSGAVFRQEDLGVAMGGVTIARNGRPIEDYEESLVARHLKGREILIEIELGSGRGSARAWTCDLTHGYISINADYRS